MASPGARVVRAVARRWMRAEASSSAEAVAHLRRAVGRTPATPLGLPGVTVRTEAHPPPSVPPGEWVGTPGAQLTLLYLHGGAYVSGRPTTYRPLVGRLCARLTAQAYVPDYRLAPEHAYPAALEDGLAAYRMVLDVAGDPSRVAVVGDSAGGGLALATLQAARDEGLPAPRCAVLLSPWTDLTGTSDSMRRNDGTDPMLTASLLDHCAEAYLAGADPRTPGASPVFGDFAGLAPLLCTVDDDEVLLDDTLRVVDAAAAAGVRAELIRRSGLLHVWLAFVPMLKEARHDMATVVAFIEEHHPR